MNPSTINKLIYTISGHSANDYMPEGKLFFLHTDHPDAEEVINAVGDLLKERSPDRFEGKKPCIHYTFRYYPPFAETFGAIRQLQYAREDARGNTSRFRGIINVNITEWKDHLSEEYFEIFMKYLSDTCKDCTVLLTGEGFSPRHSSGLKMQNSSIQKMMIRNIDLYGDRQKLSEVITCEAAEQQIRITRDHVKYLAGILKDCRPAEMSLNLIRTVLTEASENNYGFITESSIRNCAENEDTLLNLITGGKLPQRREEAEL